MEKETMTTSGSKGALGGIVSELLVIQNLRRIMFLPKDEQVDDMICELQFRLEENFFYRRKQSLPIAIAILNWIYENHYDKTVVQITWTGRKGAQEQLGICSKHPADLVVHFSDDSRFGVSIKSSTTNGSKLNFRNRGIDSLCFDMGCNLVASNCHKLEQQFMSHYGFTTRKELLINQKSDKNIKLKSKEVGTIILQKVRKDLIKFFNSQPVKVQKMLLRENFIDFTTSDLPYIKVTGLKTKAPIIEDPKDNRLINLLQSCEKLEFVASGKYVIKVKADGENIIDLSPKYSNQKIATGVIIIAR